jgi:hypothetical protein
MNYRMTEIDAKKIGSRQGLISAGFGLLIAQLIMTFMISADEGFIKAFCWFMTIDYKLNILIGAFVMLVSGHFLGQLAGKAIIIRKRNFIVIGFLTGMGVLLTTAFVSGWTGFFQEGIVNIGLDDNPFVDYIVKPLYWVTLFGTVPHQWPSSKYKYGPLTDAYAIPSNFFPSLDSIFQKPDKLMSANSVLVSITSRWDCPGQF